ncbi:MAG: sigma-70 family RNA polymerase sigma factor [Acidobacteria bacterium]|nr:sigma-70 family RNA polymerase sigma factor [Acidobacteriota bacterium]
MQGVQSDLDPAGYVEQIRQGNPAGMETLWNTFHRGIRFFLTRRLGPDDAEDRTHDAILLVVQAIQRGELREPARLAGYIRTVVRHVIAAHIGRQAAARHRQVDLDSASGASDFRENPEQITVAQERVEIMRGVLMGLSQRDREVLTRFYLREQSKQQICREMRLTETQFRLLKSRAKARFAQAAGVNASVRQPGA